MPIPYTSTADTSALDALNLDELFGSSDTGKSIFDDEDLIEIGDEIIGPFVTADRSRTTTGPTSRLLPPMVDEPLDANARKKNKKKKKLLNSGRTEDATVLAASKKKSAPSKNRPLPQSSLPSLQLPVMATPTMTTTATNPDIISRLLPDTKDVKKVTKRKDSRKKKDSGVMESLTNGSMASEPQQLNSVPELSYIHPVSSWHQQQQHSMGKVTAPYSQQHLVGHKQKLEHQHLKQQQIKTSVTAGPTTENASAKPITHNYQRRQSDYMKYQEDELLPSNTEFFPFIEIPNTINLAARKFSKAFPKLDIIYGALTGGKIAQTQNGDNDPSTSTIAEQNPINISKAKDEIVKLGQKIVVEELKDALVMLRGQKSFFHQSNENMQRWCKINFKNEEYEDLYPNSDIALIEVKVAATTISAIDTLPSIGNSAVLASEVAEVTTPTLKTASQIPPPPTASFPLQKQKIALVKTTTLSTANELNSRQSLREKFKEIATTKAIKVKIKCTAFKPPFIFNETSQRKENMKLVAHILPESVAAEMALKKALAITARKQQSHSVQQLQNQTAVRELPAQITTAAQIAQHRYAKCFQSVATTFKEKMTDLGDQMENEEMPNSTTLWKVLEDSYYAIDNFGGYCASKKKELIRFALEGTWQPELPVRVGWREPPVMRLYHSKEKRKYEETLSTCDAASEYDGIHAYPSVDETSANPATIDVEEVKIERHVVWFATSKEKTQNNIYASAEVSCESEEATQLSSDAPSNTTADVEMTTTPAYAALETSETVFDKTTGMLSSSCDKQINESTDSLNSAEKNSRGHPRLMPSLFDRLQSLLVEVDGWSKEDKYDTASEDAHEVPQGIEEDAAKLESCLVNSQTPKHMLDLSQLTLDQRTYIQLRAASLIDTSFLPRPAPLVEECEWVSSDEEDDHLCLDDQLADEIASLQKQLSCLHRSNNETVGFLQHEAFSHVSYLATEYKNREEQAAICSKASQLLRSRKKEAKQRQRLPAASSKKETFENSLPLPW